MFLAALWPSLQLEEVSAPAWPCTDPPCWRVPWGPSHLSWGLPVLVLDLGPVPAWRAGAAAPQRDPLLMGSPRGSLAKMHQGLLKALKHFPRRASSQS